MSIVLHQIDSILVGLDRKDGYLNATKLCTAYNNQKGTHKQPSDWLRSKSATEYIAYVSSVTRIVATDLVAVKQGGADEQGTWIHPDLAKNFIEWLEKATNKKSEYLYVIGDKSRSVCKIGITGDPNKRLRTIQISYPWSLDFWHCVRVKDPMAAEKLLHDRLADFRLNGEWFDASAVKLINWDYFI